MSPYLTFWTKPIDLLRENNINNNVEGQAINFWDKDENILNLYKTCAFYLLKTYDKVNLITDSNGAQFLKKIPFANVDTFLDDLPSIGAKVWSMGKVYGLKIMADRKEPFFHIDPDVFLTKKLPQNIIYSNIFVQNAEYTAFKDYQVLDFFNSIKNKYILGYKLLDHAYNHGIIGGRDYDFFKFYTDSSLKIFLDSENLKSIENHNYYLRDTPARVLNQYIFSLCGDFKNKKIETLINLEDRKNYDIISNLKIVQKRSSVLGYFHLRPEDFLINL